MLNRRVLGDDKLDVPRITRQRHSSTGFSTNPEKIVLEGFCSPSIEKKFILYRVAQDRRDFPVPHEKLLVAATIINFYEAGGTSVLETYVISEALDWSKRKKESKQF